jgi:hypothetical protein
MPFSPGATPEAKVRRTFADRIDFAYSRRILTGCAHTPNPIPLVRVFADYCDAACAISTSSRPVSQRIDASPFAAAYRSSIWIALSPLARLVYECLLVCSLDAPGRAIPAAASWVAGFLHHRHDRRAVTRVLADLERFGLVQRPDRRTHHRVVVSLTRNQVAQLELRHGTLVARERNRADAPPSDHAPTSVDLAHAVTRSPFRLVAHSSLWTPRNARRPSKGLGPIAREVYYQLAAVAADAPASRPIALTVPQLAARLDHRHSERVLTGSLRLLARTGLIRRRTRGRILVRKLTADQVAALEHRLGTRHVVDDNHASILRERDDHAHHRGEWTDAQRLVAGTSWAVRAASRSVDTLEE